MAFIIVDTANMFARAKHSVSQSDLQTGMALNIVFGSVKKAWADFKGHHVVFCLEGRSWRKDFYTPYKANRAVAKAALTPKEQEVDKIFWEAYGDFTTFLYEKTNCTVLRHPQLEADDLIAGFIQSHPNDEHVIISTDSDFHQLISPNVSQYNGVDMYHVTHNGYFDVKGRPMIDKKTGEHKKPFDPEWILFEKCIRGDTSDNVFSAYPGARVKSSKKKIGLMEAFEDRNSKGYAWNNFLLQRWTDHNGVEHRVLDDYNRNKTLIDLTQQPDNIRKIINETIESNSKPKGITEVGIRMMKFCQSYDMRRLVENIQHYADPFQRNYPTQDL
jgi:hypothetical protein